MRTLIVGGARSGKSRYAEAEARASGLAVVYVATAQVAMSEADPEMAARIARHRARRPHDWVLIEEPLALAETLARQAARSRFVIVDCLTLWLGNLLAQDGRRFQAERRALLEVLPGLEGEVWLIGNEVGMGIVPEHPLARCFADEAGWLHQDLARICERVVWVTVGLPQVLKGRCGPEASRGASSSLIAS
ncbi:MAG: bifunctional adenosylcobinamide kinase/adenosylcobinamide-phosphate guanylyltransferase [Gammaproteobacteria bacterium]